MSVVRVEKYVLWGLFILVVKLECFYTTKVAAYFKELDILYPSQTKKCHVLRTRWTNR